jgi:ATP-binding cassette, subfamily G (WHITE), member 2, PDR
MDHAANGANIANLLFSLSLIFCGVLATKDSPPGSWIFMYRVSPFTYLVAGMLSAGVANTDIVCAANEYLRMQPVSGSTCGQYLDDYVTSAKGYVLDSKATSDCLYCPTSNTNDYLASISIYWIEAWRKLGLVWVYIAVNVAGALAIYWFVRMPEKVKAEKSRKA